MPRIKFHKIAAIAVLVVTAAWIATGEFSSVGSASQEAEARQAEEAEESAAPAALKTVIAAEPPRQQHARTIHVSGRTEADKRTVLAARSGGVIEELTVSKGDEVEKNEILLRQETEGKQAAVESARQALTQRQAEAEAAERLAKSGNIARLQLDAARAALASARSALEQAEAELDRVMVRAPFSGVIDEVHVEEGASIMQGSQVATLLKLDPILAVGEVNERNIGSVQIGDTAEVRLVDGRTLEGKVRYLSHAATPETRTYPVEVAIENPDRSIPAGMTAEISIMAKRVETVALPRSVVTLNSEGDLGVRSVDASGRVAFHAIDIVDDTPGALYLAGIPADARIIVSGQDLVTEGETVQVEMADRSMVEELARSTLQNAAQ